MYAHGYLHMHTYRHVLLVSFLCVDVLCTETLAMMEA
jgi:hypothetical protein